MLVIDNGDSIRGIAEVATKLDFIVNGYVGVTATQLADGQLGTSEADLYASGADATVVTSITIVNRDSAARTFTLYLKPSGGTSRAISPISLDLGIGHSFYTDGQRTVVMDKSGNILSTTTVLAHDLGGASHTADTLSDLNSKISDATLVDTDSIVLKVLFNAQTLLAAVNNNDPAPLTVVASRIVGRKASGNIDALTGAEILAILSGQAAADFALNSKKLTGVTDPDADQDAATKKYVDTADDALDYGLSFEGIITTATDSTHFKVSTLAGKGTGFFKPTTGAAYEIYVVEADGAAPEGERTPVVAYTTGDGTFEHLAFTQQLAVGDIVLIMFPAIFDTYNLRGGVGGIADILENQAAELDLAEVRTIASPVTLTAAFQYVHSEAPGRPFHFFGGFFSRASGTWTNSEAITVNVEVKIDGSNWVEIWTKNYTADPTPVLFAVPCEDPDDVLTNFPHDFVNNGDGVRVGIKQTVQGDGYHTYNHSFLNAVAGT